MSTWVGQYEPLSLCCLWTKVHQSFWPNVEGVVVDNGIFQTVDMTICSEDIRDQSRFVPKIFAIKVESCQTMRRILDIFSPSQILGGGPFENCTRVITPALRLVDWDKFHEDTPTKSGVIVAHTLNFWSNFKFSRLKFCLLLSPTPMPKPFMYCTAGSVASAVFMVNRVVNFPEI